MLRKIVLTSPKLLIMKYIFPIFVLFSILVLAGILYQPDVEISDPQKSISNTRDSSWLSEGFERIKVSRTTNKTIPNMGIRTFVIENPFSGNLDTIFAHKPIKGARNKAKD
jgi:hypothetical protein